MAVAQHDLQAGVERLEALGAALAAAGARQSAWAPFLLGCFVATTVLLLLTGLAAAAAYSWWASDRHRRRLTEAADLAGARNSTLRKVLGEVLPAW